MTDLSALFGMQQPLSDAQRAEQERAVEYARRAAVMDQEHRERVLKFGAVLCGCRRWWQAGSEPPQASCIVHGSMMITLDGKVL